MSDLGNKLNSLKDLDLSFGGAGASTPGSVKDDELKRRLKYKRDLVGWHNSRNLRNNKNKGAKKKPRKELEKRNECDSRRYVNTRSRWV